MNHHLYEAKSWKAKAKHPLTSTSSLPAHFGEEEWSTGINQPLQLI